MRWTNTIAAAAEVELAQNKGQWKIGDAVIRDLKENNLLEKIENRAGLFQFFGECAEALSAKGISGATGKPYDSTYVRYLFEAAHNFPRDERNPKYSWDTHQEAGTPDTLRKAAIALRKLGKSITKYNVRELVGHWAEEADSQRRAAVSEAKSKKDKAQAKKAKAAETAMGATSPAVRAKALEEREAAKAEIKEAIAVIKEQGSAPKFNADAVDPNDTDALQRWAVYMGILAHTSRMKSEAKKTLAEVNILADGLSESERDGIEEACNEIVAILDKINALVKRRPTLATIKGGKA